MMKKKQSNNRIRLKDIALRSGLTITSVSRALQGCSNISVATQQRVKAIALEMGYFSNHHAQSLRNGHFPVIAVVYDNFKNPFYGIVTGIIDALIRDHNYRSMVFNEYNKESRLGLDLAQEISSFNLSGVITFLVPTEEALQLFQKMNTPITIIGRDGSEIGISSVSSNDFKGGYLAGRHLIERGAKNCIYLGIIDTLSINKNRYAGFKQALMENELEPHCIFNNDNQPTNQILNLAFEKIKNIDGIFCFNDLIAFEVVNHLLERNLKVPEQVNVIGYDNLQREINYPFRLTTIDADMYITANHAVEILFAQIEDTQTQVNNQIVDVRLVIGKTTKRDA